jgi:nitrogen fixation protein FixH
MTVSITRSLVLLFALTVAAPLAAQSEKPMPMPMPGMPAAAKPAADGLAIALKTTPAPPKAGSNQFEVTVKDKAGKPVADADVSVTFVMAAMPQMKMPEMRKTTMLKPAGGGKYSASGEVMMAGHWDVIVSVKRGGKEIGTKKMTVDAR